MIDTARFAILGEYDFEHLEKSLSSQAWSRTEYRDTSRRDATPTTYTHAATGLKIIGNENRPTSVEVSLPTVLFGSNGRLIKSQRVLNAAIRETERIVGEVLNPYADRPFISHFRRVDLVWHLLGDFKFFESYAKQLPVRARVARRISYENESLLIGGKSQSLEFCFYDKVKQMTKKGFSPKMQLNGHTVIRLEIRLRSSSRLKDLNGDKNWVHSNKGLRPFRYPRFDGLYATFRDRLIELQGAKIPLGKGPEARMAELELLAHEKCCAFSPLEILLSDYKPDTARKKRKRISRLMAGAVSFQFERVFPSASPPPALDVFSKASWLLPTPLPGIESPRTSAAAIWRKESISVWMPSKVPVFDPRTPAVEQLTDFELPPPLPESARRRRRAPSK